MKILIATGIYPPDIGGPAQIARGVEQALIRAGHRVKVLAFRFERKLPTVIRHVYYFLRVLFSLRGADFVFSPDTFSAALPALFAAKLAGKRFIVRTGGDFLWESYVERTGDLVLLRNFYKKMATPPSSSPLKRGGGRGGVRLNLKERIIFRLLRFLLRHTDAVIFSTAWQRDIFRAPYKLDLSRCFVVENFYGPKVPQIQHTDKLDPEYQSKARYGAGNVGVFKKVFVGGVRDLKWKNMPRLKEAFDAVQEKGIPVALNWETGSRGKFLLDIESAYAVIIASLGDISPNTILEAIAFDKPFILTRECGFYEKLKGIGVWVDPEDVNDIAAKIGWLADEENYRAQKKKVQAFNFTHSYEEVAEELITIYRNIDARA